jgi:hypothetical protein
LKPLRIDTSTDHNTRDTAARVAKMYVEEIFAGRFDAAARRHGLPQHRRARTRPAIPRPNIRTLVLLAPLRANSRSSSSSV